MSRPRVLVTGASGFSGSHLCELALRRGAEVFGFARREAFPDGVKGRAGDITQRSEIEDWIAACRPEWIFHLAGVVRGGGASSAEELFRVNVDGTRQLLEAVRNAAPDARVFVAGSSAIYAQPSRPDAPLNEDAAVAPRSDYARSKAEQDRAARESFERYGLHVVRGRTFNLTGPREPAALVCAALARQVARIEAGRQERVVTLVTLRTRRDFCDVRDAVAGYWAALAHGAPGAAYNIGSGRSHSIREILDHLLAAASLTGMRIVETEPEPASQPIVDQVADTARLRACSGWMPRIPLEQSLRDLLDDWRARR